MGSRGRLTAQLNTAKTNTPTNAPQILLGALLSETGGAAPSLLVALRGPAAAPAPGAVAYPAARAAPAPGAIAYAAHVAAPPMSGHPAYSATEGVEVLRGTPVIVAPDGAVLEPALDAFNVIVAPGQHSVQAAVDACPPGGSVLLLPGTHDGSLVLTAGNVVHVFGRGKATLRAETGAVVLSESSASTLDGLIIRREAGGTCVRNRGCVWIKGGRLRLQACDIASAAINVPCVVVEEGADPLLVECRYVHVRASGGRSLSLFLPV